MFLVLLFKPLLPIRKKLLLYFSIHLFIICLLVGVAIASKIYDVPIESFTADPVVTLKGHPLTGIISHIGILLWCSTAAICYFSAFIQKNLKHRKTSQFLNLSGLITLILLLDDLFLFHEEILPEYFYVPQKLIYIIYVIVAASYVVKFRFRLLESEYIFLLMAFLYFAISISFDIFLSQSGIAYLAEDGFKLFGIVNWFLFFANVCLQEIQGSINLLLE